MGMMQRLRGDDTPRVAVIGLDGVPFSLLMDHPDRFEHIHAISEAGCGASMSSAVPAESSTTWPCLTTGLNPGETGVYGLIDRTINSYETYITAADDVQAPHVWDHVTEAGRQASVLNVPVTYPPQRNLQRMVSGFQAPDIERAVYPRSLAEPLESLSYHIDVDATLGNGDVESFLEDAYTTLDARYDTFAHFIGREDWDLFVGVFMTADRVNHFLYGEYLEEGPYREDFLSFYEQLDTYIGAIRSRLAADVPLVIVSEHGFTTLEWEVQLNALLEQEGWLAYRSGDADRLAAIDASTRAYALPSGRLYLNLEGREPRGRISQEEYELTRDRLCDVVLDWTGPDGRPIAREVVTREHRYRGPHVDLAPDLVVIPNDGFDLQARFAADLSVFHRTKRTGMHREDDASFFLDLPGSSVSEPTIYDITPTLLSLLDIDFNRADFDGASLL